VWGVRAKGEAKGFFPLDIKIFAVLFCRNRACWDWKKMCKRFLVGWGLAIICVFGACNSGWAKPCCNKTPTPSIVTLYSGSEQILWVGFKPHQVVAANPAVVRGGVIFPLSSQRIYLKALAPGRTKVMIWGKRGQKHELEVRVLTKDLRSQLHEIRSKLKRFKDLCFCISHGRIVIKGEVTLPQELAEICGIAATYPQVQVRVRLKHNYLARLATKLAQALKPWRIKVYPASSQSALILEGQLSTQEDYYKVIWIAQQYYPDIVDRLVLSTPNHPPITMAGTFVP